jgi:hypothetical protein
MVHRWRAQRIDHDKEVCLTSHKLAPQLSGEHRIAHHFLG